ncbi:ATP-binding cassette domain-containing protein [Pseudomonas asiatica]|uniref:ATP-binding cassette domain-containing protein n=1 Tax=Pseudomonas asiatica TaxID=2219225 RepID=A0AAJ5IQS1_9PSED|nr:ATP-binding cassette domain-containing protein [Pseudomonas asiatica]UUC21435.1 ATP-binding cassette domain-containing protein [Pseudomonas asiatica]
MEQLLALENVHKSYGSFKVTEGVDLCLGQGEALGIFGPNGAGKSTLFNLIAGGVMSTQKGQPAGWFADASRSQTARNGTYVKTEDDLGSVFTPECCRDLANNLHSISRKWVASLGAFRRETLGLR